MKITGFAPIASAMLLLSASVLAQPQLEATFNKSDIGYSYRVGANYFFKKRFSVGAALKFIEWIPISDNQNYAYRNRFKPDNFKQVLGFNCNFNYYFLKRDRVFSPFVFYDFSFSKSNTVFDGYYWIYDPSQPSQNPDNALYLRVTGETGPVRAYEHYIGIGFDVQLYKGLWLTQKIGPGWAHFYVIDPTYYGGGYRDGGQLAWMWNIGLKFDLGNGIWKREKTQ